MKRHFISLAASAALLMAPLSALAADDSQPANQATAQAPLAAGPAAGVTKAQGFVMGTTGWVVLGIAAAVIVAVAASGNGNGHATTTTSGTP
jgi:hypothetical protein